MTKWEKKIAGVFIGRYDSDSRLSLRLRSSAFFPDFDNASSDEKESYLEAAESLEKKGLLKLNWEKWGKGEKLKTLSCENFELLFKEAGIPFPKTEAEEIRAMLGAMLADLSKEKSRKEASNQKFPAQRDVQNEERIINFLEFYSKHFGPREIGQGIDKEAMTDFAKLLEYIIEPSRLEKITTRSLSILLYHDSKRLEKLLTLCSPLLSRAQKMISETKGHEDTPWQAAGYSPPPSNQSSGETQPLVPDLTFLERSFPELLISGEIIIEYKSNYTPLINDGSHILGLPYETAKDILSIKLINESSAGRTSTKEKTVLTIENKETFYALASPQMQGESKELSGFDCFLYIGGYSNRAAAVMVKILSASGFSFYHAGDLDPDGVLILQHIQDLAGKPVTPVRMDAATFDQYRAWGRSLTKPMLGQMKKIREETRALPGIAGLLRRIEETGLGVEQEIVDYR